MLASSVGDDYKVERIRESASAMQLVLTLPIVSSEADHPLLDCRDLSESDSAMLGEIGAAGRPITAKGREFVRNVIAESLKGDISEAFLALDTASRTTSALIAGSRAEVLAIQRLERDSPRSCEIEEWETVRTIRLPWVQRLAEHGLFPSS